MGRPRKNVQTSTPAAQPGMHAYQIASDGSVALHTYSTFSKAPVTEIVGKSTLGSSETGRAR